MLPLFKESNKLKIIQANIKDAVELYRCNKECLPIVYNLDQYIDLIKSKEKIILLAKINNITAGYIIGQYYPKKNNLHIISFAVYQKFRRKNIGTILMNNIIKISKEINKINTLSLYVMESNIIAQKFYLSMEFTKYNRIPQYYSLVEDAIIYIKILNK